jgi:hypothetical protein
MGYLFVLVAVLITNVCYVAPQEGQTGKRVVDGESDFAVAKRWMEALKANNATELTKATALPFTFATTNRVKKCEGSFKTIAAFSRWTNCVRKSEKYLLSELNAGHVEIHEDVSGSSKSAYDLRADNIGNDTLSDSEAKSLDTLAKKVSANGTWVVRASTSASEIQYHFRWVVVKGADGSRQIAAFLVGEVVFE